MAAQLQRVAKFGCQHFSRLKSVTNKFHVPRRSDLDEAIAVARSAVGRTVLIGRRIGGAIHDSGSDDDGPVAEFGNSSWPEVELSDRRPVNELNAVSPEYP